MSVMFQEIPGEWPVPGSYTEISSTPAPGSLLGMPLRAVIIGPTSNKDLSNQLQEYITIGQAEALYGIGSILTQTIRAFLTENPTMSVDAIGVAVPDANIGTAKGSFAFSGTVLSDGTAVALLGGVRVSWPVKQGDEAPTVAANMVAAAKANSEFARTGLLIEQGSDDNNNQVIITAGEAGECWNAVNLGYDTANNNMISGISILIYPMEGGAGIFPVDDALLALGETWYTDLIYAGTDDSTTLTLAAEAKRRKEAMVAKDMRVYYSDCSTLGQAIRDKGSVATSDDGIYIPLYKARACPWQVSAAVAAQVAQSLTNDPARQLRTLPLNTLTNLGPEPIDQFSQTQRSVLLQNGCSTVNIQSDGTITLERVITTRTKDPKTGQATGVWDVMIPAIAARIRYEWNSYVNEVYNRAKLADDDSPLADADGVVTCRTLKASWIAQCLLYQKQGWIDDVATLGAQARFERNAEDRSRVDSFLPIKPMGSLIVLANSLQLQV